MDWTKTGWTKLNWTKSRSTTAVWETNVYRHHGYPRTIVPRGIRGFQSHSTYFVILPNLMYIIIVFPVNFRLNKQKSQYPDQTFPFETLFFLLYIFKNKYANICKRQLQSNTSRVTYTWIYTYSYAYTPVLMFNFKHFQTI